MVPAVGIGPLQPLLVVPVSTAYRRRTTLACNWRLNMTAIPHRATGSPEPETDVSRKAAR